MKVSKALTVSMSIFRGQIMWRFSLSKNNISPAAPDLELILFQLWYWPIMNAHTKQQQVTQSNNKLQLVDEHITILCIFILSWIKFCLNQSNNKVFEMDFIDSQKSDPPFAHLLALSHVCVLYYCFSSKSMCMHLFSMSTMCASCFSNV